MNDNGGALLGFAEPQVPDISGLTKLLRDEDRIGCDHRLVLTSNKQCWWVLVIGFLSWDPGSFDFAHIDYGAFELWSIRGVIKIILF